jgi:CPA2 family monovalent cation:H+ antiporter-2
VSGSHVLIELVIVLGMAALVTVVFQALRLPVVLGYVLAGLLIGPHVPVPLVANADLVHVLSELGVILLMFTIGLELRLSTIARVGLPAALTALFEVALAISLGTLVAGLLGFDALSALFAGACLGISSTMLVAKAFEELGWKGGFTEIVFAILVFEDLIAILLLVILGGVGGVGVNATDVALTLGKLTGFLALILVGGLLVVPRSIAWISTKARSETLIIASLALCFGISALAHWAGYSVALGAFVAGILIAESGKGHDVFELVKPLRDVFAMVFFVSVGMTIDPALLAQEAWRIGILTVVVLVVKSIGVTTGVFLAGHGVRPAVRAGLSLAQIGELSFVIAAAVPAGEINLLAIAVGIACATTLTSPLLIRNSDAISVWVAERLPKSIATFVSFYEAWLARLRARDSSTWKRFKRPVVVMIVDAAIVVGIVIAASTIGSLQLAEMGITGPAATLAQVGGALLLAAPFAVGAIRRIAIIARRLAADVIPAHVATDGAMDLGRAPRRVLVLTLELAIALAIAVPAVAATQPFVPASPLVVGLVFLVVLLFIRRSIADFEGHVRAGSELVLELLAQPAPAGENKALDQVQTILPGFGGVTPLELPAGSPAVGRSLAELDLRAKTGATVLAIHRGEHGVATPSPTDPLRAGDVLALAGSEAAIAAAREVLDPSPGEPALAG